MAKIHYFQRYSSIENTVTNNTLQLIARIYEYSNHQASKLLSDLTDTPIEIGIEINQQERKAGSIPDGQIVQSSFRILIESKVDSGVSDDQLLRHARNFKNETQKILLLVTKRKISEKDESQISNKIKSEIPGVIFKNVTYEFICTALQGLFKEFEDEMKYLVDDYIEYCNDTGLFDQSPYFMRIVPCGDTVKINTEFAMYYQPTDRGYTNHSYIGIYYWKTVRAIFKIDSVFDVVWDGIILKKTLVKGRETNEYDDKLIKLIGKAKECCGHIVNEGHRFFCGKEAIDTDYKKISSGGIMGARLINLKSIIGDFKDEKEIAEKLKTHTWE